MIGALEDAFRRTSAPLLRRFPTVRRFRADGALVFAPIVTTRPSETMSFRRALERRSPSSEEAARLAAGCC